MQLSSQNRAHPHHIILVGLMGCGKSTVGRWLSKKTGRPLLDMDSLIEEQIGKTIPEIFAEEGEAHFRSLETALLHYLETETQASQEGYIISTGGGVVERPENRAILHELGFCVWLNVELEALLLRTARGHNRPLLMQSDPRAVLEQLTLRRNPLYEATAHLRLDTTHLEVQEVVAEIQRHSAVFFGTN